MSNNNLTEEQLLLIREGEAFVKAKKEGFHLTKQVQLNGFAGCDAKATKNGRAFFTVGTHPNGRDGATVWFACFAEAWAPGAQEVKKGMQVSLLGIDLGERTLDNGNVEHEFNVDAIRGLRWPVKRQAGTDPNPAFKEGEKAPEQMVFEKHQD